MYQAIHLLQEEAIGDIHVELGQNVGPIGFA
jgi:hypothetical protein